MAKNTESNKRVGFVARSGVAPRPGFFGGQRGFKLNSQKFGKTQYRTQHKG